MIYYVIPRELADKYYKEFKKRFAGVEGVEVISRPARNRPALADRRGRQTGLRDRRRRRMSGSFPDV